MNGASDFTVFVRRVEDPDGEREKAQCQSGQLDGNKAVVDGDVVDPHMVEQALSLSPYTNYTHTTKPTSKIHPPTHLQ